MCTHLNHPLFIKLESGFEPSDALVGSTLKPCSTQNYIPQPEVRRECVLVTHLLACDASEGLQLARGARLGRAQRFRVAPERSSGSDFFRDPEWSQSHEEEAR